MSKIRSAACAVIGAMLFLALGLPAGATHQPTQAIPGGEGINSLFVGIDDAGTATAIWGDRFGSPIEYSSRLRDGRFGVPVDVPGTDRVSEVAYDSASNGNMIVAWLDTSGASQIRASVKIGRGAGFRKHQVVHTSTAVNIYGVETATSDSGRSVIVWSETQSGGVQEVRAALSNNSGVFGAPVTLASEPGAEWPQVDMGADGSALAVWDVNTASNARVMAAGAPAGQPFGAERLVEALGQGAGQPEVAVNASGQAFVAYHDLTPDPCPGTSCANFWIEMKFGSVTGAFTPAGGMPPNAESGYSFVSHDVALNDSGEAAILTSGATPDGSYGVLARTSDASGTFGSLQELSGEGQIGGPGIADDEMELVSAGGEFSAIWSNDANADGQTNEVSLSSTSQGIFEAPHQVAGPSQYAFEVSVARNPSGEVVAVWSDFQDELLIGSPVNPTASAAVYGTSGADNLAGTSGADSAWLGGGNDRFNGRGGNDRISGEAGADFLDGGAGANVLNGGPGKDTCVKRSRRDKLTSCERVRRNH